MSLKDWMIRKLGGRSHTIPVSGRLPLANRALAPDINVGTWVRWEGRTAIATGIVPGGLISIDVVDERGQTVLATHQPAGALRRARISEVPEARRKVDALRRRGYQE